MIASYLAHTLIPRYRVSHRDMRNSYQVPLRLPGLICSATVIKRLGSRGNLFQGSSRNYPAGYSWVKRNGVPGLPDKRIHDLSPPSRVQNATKDQDRKLKAPAPLELSIHYFFSLLPLSMEPSRELSRIPKSETRVWIRHIEVTLIRIRVVVQHAFPRRI